MDFSLVPSSSSSSSSSSLSPSSFSPALSPQREERVVTPIELNSLAHSFFTALAAYQRQNPSFNREAYLSYQWTKATTTYNPEKLPSALIRSALLPFFNIQETIRMQKISKKFYQLAKEALTACERRCHNGFGDFFPDLLSQKREIFQEAFYTYRRALGTARSFMGVTCPGVFFSQSSRVGQVVLTKLNRQICAYYYPKEEPCVSHILPRSCQNSSYAVLGDKLIKVTCTTSSQVSLDTWAFTKNWERETFTIQLNPLCCKPPGNWKFFPKKIETYSNSEITFKVVHDDGESRHFINLSKKEYLKGSFTEGFPPPDLFIYQTEKRKCIQIIECAEDEDEQVETPTFDPGDDYDTLIYPVSTSLCKGQLSPDQSLVAVLSSETLDIWNIEKQSYHTKKEKFKDMEFVSNSLLVAVQETLAKDSMLFILNDQLEVLQKLEDSHLYLDRIFVLPDHTLHLISTTYSGVEREFRGIRQAIETVDSAKKGKRKAV